MKIDIADIIKEAIEKKKEDRTEQLIRMDEVTKVFDSKFGHLGFKFWKFIYRVRTNDEEEEFAPAYKHKDEWDALGISRWASFALMHGQPILSAYQGIEEYLASLSEIWAFVGEKDDQLVIVSNYPNRCGLIKAV